jgi:alkyldihydroxyacetonephosphate synthase
MRAGASAQVVEELLALRPRTGRIHEGAHRPLDEWPARLKGFTGVDGAGRPAVVEPDDAEGVAAIVRWARDRRVRVQALGSGSNVVGAVSPDADVLVSLARLRGIRELDLDSHTVTVGAGTEGAELEDHLTRNGLTLGHYPQSLRVSSVGGWIATRATGTYSALYGGIERLLVGVEVVLPTGEIVAVGPRPRPSGGFDLTGFLCGAEGTLGIVTAASLAVSRLLPERRVCAAFPSLAAGLAAERELVHAGIPIGLVRLYNAAESQVAAEGGSLRDGECLLVLTTRATGPLLDAAEAAAAGVLADAGGRPLPPSAADPWFRRRYAGPGFMAERNRGDGVVFDTIEVGLPWRTAAACADELERTLATVSDPVHLHFSHVYPTGVCLYAMVHIDAGSEDTARGRWETAWSSTLDAVARHGGTLSHHHGIGAARAARYRRTPEGRLHALLAGALDPGGLMAGPLLVGGADG